MYITASKIRKTSVSKSHSYRYKKKELKSILAQVNEVAKIRNLSKLQNSNKVTEKNVPSKESSSTASICSSSTLPENSVASTSKAVQENNVASNENLNVSDVMHIVDNVEVNISTESHCNDKTKIQKILKKDNFSKVQDINITSLEKENNDLDTKKFVRELGLRHNLSHVAISEILFFLHRKLPEEDIPIDARTLLRTDKKVPYKIIKDNVKFNYIGLHRAIVNLISDNVNNLDNNELKLNIFIDGFPITKSKSHQMWPILASLRNIKYCSPQFVALATGLAKPKILNEYLDPLVDELAHFF